MALPHDADLPEGEHRSTRIRASSACATGRVHVSRSATGTGLVKLDPDHRRVLAKGWCRLIIVFLGIEFEACWIIEHGRGAPSTGKAPASLAGGLAILGFGIWLFVRGRKRKALPTGSW